MLINITLINEHGISKNLSTQYSEKDSLLEHIESAGGSSPYGCRVGSCGTCVAKITDGIEYLKERDSLEEECCSRVSPSEGTARLLCRAAFDPEKLLEGAIVVIEKIKIV